MPICNSTSCSRQQDPVREGLGQRVPAEPAAGARSHSFLAEFLRNNLSHLKCILNAFRPATGADARFVPASPAGLLSELARPEFEARSCAVLYEAQVNVQPLAEVVHFLLCGTGIRTALRAGQITDAVIRVDTQNHLRV